MTQFTFPTVAVRFENGATAGLLQNTDLRINTDRNGSFTYQLTPIPTPGVIIPSVNIEPNNFTVVSGNGTLPGEFGVTFLGDITWDDNSAVILVQQFRVSDTEVISFLVNLGGDPLPNFQSAGAVRNFLSETVETSGVASGPFAPGQSIPLGSIPGVDISENETFQGTGADDSFSGAIGNDELLGAGGEDTLRGGSGEDTLLGGTGDDTLIGGTDNDILRGGGNNDILRGGGGGDTLNGGNGNDTLRGNAGSDRLTGGDGQDKLSGNGGNDVLNGGSGGDDLRGNGGNDQLVGELGRDTLNGGTGADRLLGGGGNDRLFGGAGNDTLRGGLGNDTLDGGLGADVLSGNAGRDVFMFADGTGQDRIRDFASGEDQIDLEDVSEITNFDDLINNHAQQNGDNVVITDGNGVSVTVEDILLGDLEAGDFIF